MGILQTQHLTLSYGSETIINNLNITIPNNKITVLIGSNGCGKSTLLRSLARLLKPKNGNIFLSGKDIAKSSTKQVAKQLAILPQNTSAPEGITVFQLVKQGRYPHQTWFRQWSEQDEQMVDWALKVTKMEEFKQKQVDSLSGGQRQRAWIAMILAQGTSTLLLDEPTTFLDLTHQIELLDILYQLNREQKSTIVMVLHDLNLACRYADHFIAIKDKQVYVQGSPKEIVTKEMVQEVFDLNSEIISDPIYGTPMCIPFGKQFQSS